MEILKFIAMLIEILSIIETLIEIINFYRNKIWILIHFYFSLGEAGYAASLYFYINLRLYLFVFCFSFMDSKTIEPFDFKFELRIVRAIGIK